MNDIIAKITPLTRGIIWFPKGTPKSTTNAYKAVDYLLNGLLTAGLTAKGSLSSQVNITTNFHYPLYVFIVQDFKKAEYESYLKLLKGELTAESTILVIDETETFNMLIKESPADIKSRLHLLK